MADTDKPQTAAAAAAAPAAKTAAKKPKSATEKKGTKKVAAVKPAKSADKKPKAAGATKRPATDAAAAAATKKKAAGAAGTPAKKLKKAKHSHGPRNYDLGNGVYRFSRSRMYKKKAIYMKIHKNQPPKPKAKKRSQFLRKPIGGEKNGSERVVRVKKQPRYYPTAPKPKKPKTRKNNFAKHSRRLRKSITPGTVLIIVAGKHRGKRVVFLKQLKTGLLLVTGPFKLNRCPLRRINQIYVMATKTRLDIKEVDVPNRLDDKYFKRIRPKRPKKDEGEIFETKKESYQVTEQRKKDQILVDKQLLEVIRKRPDRKYMFGYLGSMFSLRNHMYPHKMVF